MVVCFRRGDPVGPLPRTYPSVIRIAALELLNSLLLFMFAADRVNTHHLEVHIPLRTDNKGNACGLQEIGKEVALLGSLDGTFGPGAETISFRIAPPCQTMFKYVGGPTHSLGLHWVRLAATWMASPRPGCSFRFRTS